ncbi:MAG: hypothetical protein KDA50_10400 [Rhodobacteraceae bacterium]|nr:hypothetical protein [Paracoccaceae bacterium]
MDMLSSLPGLIAAQDWPRAEALLRRAARKKGAPAEVFYNLAKVLEARGAAEQMGSWLRRAVAARPDYGLAWFELGRWALTADDADLAYDAFRAALRLLPGDLDARVNLGRLALRRGAWDAAARAWDGVAGPEADIARFRIAAETGQNTPEDLSRLLRDPATRGLALQAMTRTARGCVPLTLPPVDQRR